MKIIFTVFFSLISFTLFAQGINNLWLMGYNGGGGGINMDFNTGVLNITQQRSRIMNFDETNGEICDKNGNLLFSSNGIFIANAANDTMVNGSGLNPSYLTTEKYSDGLTIPQANLVIPFPSDSTKYYLFHETDDNYFSNDASFYLYYSIIDMSQDSGKGKVIQKNVVLLNDTLELGHLTACKHANGRDCWLFAHQCSSNRYFEYLITPSGIQGPFFQDFGAVRPNDFGQMAFSSDGKAATYYDPGSGLDIMGFDRCSGTFSNLVHVDINDSAESVGAAFSPNSKVLYVSSMNYIYQFDLTSSNVASSKTTVAIYDGYFSPAPPLATNFYLAQLAPDGKIYIVCGNSTEDIHVINYPDSIGLGCDVCQHCVHLPAENAFTIANHPNYFLGAESGSVCDSLEGVRNFSVQRSTFEVFPNPIVNDEVTFTYNVSSEQV